MDPGAGDSNGEEPPESLFMKELKRRGMSPTSSSREDSGRGLYEKEIGAEEESGGFKSKRNGVASVEYDEGTLNQRERSLALNSEGLEFFGSAFVHDGSDMSASPPPYIDPYALLEDERMSPIAPHMN